MDERCGQSYHRNGDVRECLLQHNHDGDCTSANAAATLEPHPRPDKRWVF